MFRKLVLSTAAATLALSPVAAQAAPQRTAAPVESEQEALAGGFLLPVLIAVALGVAIWLIHDSDDDVPVSP